MTVCEACPLGRASRPERCPFREVSRPSGAVLVAQGEVPGHVWFVRSGAVVLSSVSECGDELTCTLRGAGALIGLEGLRRQPSEQGAWALSDVVACRLGRDAFTRWSEPRGPLGAVLELALDEIARHRRERAALAGTTVMRVARFLLWRHRALEARALPVDQGVLSRMLAMRPETLSRALGELRRKGAITPERGARVLDATRLAELAGEASPPG